MSKKINSHKPKNNIISEIHYKIVRKLGEGMFSTVKLATHSLLGEQVAIKILEKTRVSNLEDKERINREIAIMRKLNHFNIAKLYQIVETKLTIYLIQENIQGKEFFDYLTKKGKLKEVEACKFFHQIISGLEYIHQCGVVHRDFKPENILITNNDTILKIIDFGLGNLYENKQLLKTACGSPCYAPPEMIKEEKYNGAESDIWSSGIILYLMLCGKLPFYHENNEIMYQKILSGKFEHPNFLSEKAKDILNKILEINPKKRLNFKEIKSHPWFNIIDKNEFMHKGINIKEDIVPIDEEIIEKMEKIGFNKIEVRFNLIKNFHNKITSVYDLLLKKKIENGNKSIADMHSDLYDEYINDKKNKISYYGSLDKVLKHRISDDNKVLKVLPNYYEDQYDDNNEDMIVGDNGSVIERLIKSGRFTYDEENMCLSKVSNINRQNNKKGNNDNGENKFKTITEMNHKTKKFIKKNVHENSVKRSNTHFEDEQNSQKESHFKHSPSNLKKSQHMKKSETHAKINDLLEDENEKTNNEDERNKELEEFIVEEEKSKKKPKDRRISKKNVRIKRSSTLTKRPKNQEENNNFDDINLKIDRMIYSNRKEKPKISQKKEIVRNSNSVNRKVILHKKIPTKPILINRTNSYDKRMLRKTTLGNRNDSYDKRFHRKKTLEYRNNSYDKRMIDKSEFENNKNNNINNKPMHNKSTLINKKSNNDKKIMNKSTLVNYNKDKDNLKTSNSIDIRRKNTYMPQKLKIVHTNNNELKNSKTLRNSNAKDIYKSDTKKLNNSMRSRLYTNKGVKNNKTNKKQLKNSSKKTDEISEFLSPEKVFDSSNFKTSHETNKFVKMIKHNRKKTLNNNKNKKFEVEDDDEDSKDEIYTTGSLTKRREYSDIKRKKRMKI